MRSLWRGLITDTTKMANGNVFEVAIQNIKQYYLEDKMGIQFNLPAGKQLIEMAIQCVVFALECQFLWTVELYNLAFVA